MKKIFFVRHGQTDLNKDNIVQGSGVDASINELGRSQAKALFSHYSHIPFENIYCSNLIRTKETMAPFIEKGIPYETTALINEMGWGVHEGKKSTPEMIGAYKSMIAAWGEGDLDARLEDGESARELRDRLAQFLQLIKNQPEQYILVCTHGRALRCLMCLLKGQEMAAMEDYVHSNTGVFYTEFDGNDFEVLIENDTKHLSKSS